MIRVKPFLLLATRAEDAVADAEAEAILRFGGLSPAELVRIRLESAPLDELLPNLDLTAYSGVLMGGSPFTSTDPDAKKSATQRRVEIELAKVIAEIVALDVPFLGACYGISTLGLFLGGVLDRAYAEPISAVPITLTDAGCADPLLAGLPGASWRSSGTRRHCTPCRPARYCLPGRRPARCRCSGSGSTSTPPSSIPSSTCPGS